MTGTKLPPRGNMVAINDTLRLVSRLYSSMLLLDEPVVFNIKSEK